MLKKTITYTDWNGTERTEDFYFNLTRAEILELEYKIIPGQSLSDSIQTLIQSQDMGKIIETIKLILLASYGEKSADGKRFVKNDDIRAAFEQNPAFDTLYMSLVTDAEYAAEFVAGIMPAAIRDELGSNPKAAIMDRASSMAKLNN